VHAIQAMHQGKAKAFFGLGGNFLSATPDTEYTAEELRGWRLNVRRCSAGSSSTDAIASRGGGPVESVCACGVYLR
jgi:hypothetical protein